MNSKGCNLVASLTFTPANMKEIQQVERNKVVKLNQNRVWGGLFICICESIKKYICCFIKAQYTKLIFPFMWSPQVEGQHLHPLPFLLLFLFYMSPLPSSLPVYDCLFTFQDLVQVVQPSCNPELPSCHLKPYLPYCPFNILCIRQV